MLIGIQSNIKPGLLVGEEISVPYSATAFTQATGITPTSYYTCQNASGALVDIVAGNNLTQVGTPSYRKSVSFYVGVGTDVAASGFAANVNDPGLSSCIFGAIGTFPKAFASLPGIFGRNSSTGFPACAIYRALNTVKYPTFLVRDATLQLALSDSNINVVDPERPILYLGQVDRAASTARFYVADSYKALTSLSGSISGFGTLSGGTTPNCFIGGAGGLSSGFSCALAFFATGTQCEGVILPTLARRLNFG